MTGVAYTDPPDFMQDLARSRSARLLRDELGLRWPETSDGLSEIIRYALLPAGKLIRPILTLHCTEAVGGRPEDALPAALGMEYLHVATLVHDDIIDADKLRRGRPAVPTAFGMPGAIVAGDHLIFIAFTSIVECADAGVADELVVSAINVLAEAGSDLCRGQIMEARLAGDPGTGVSEYLEMIRLKTGALFRAVCHIGAILGGGGPAETRLLADYGENLGMAFQIRDDLLGYTAGVDEIGKPTTSDLANGRPTLPILLAYEASPPADRRALAAALDSRSGDPAVLAHVRGILRGCGALAEAWQRADAYVARARINLSTLEVSPSVRLLDEVARWATAAGGQDG